MEEGLGWGGQETMPTKAPASQAFGLYGGA